MSKPPAKRKASDANLDDAVAGRSNQLLASLDLSNSKTKPKTIATALLSLLPDGASRQHPDAKKLAKAFPLVLAELDARSSALARANESEGTKQPIAFRFSDEGGNDTVINVPEECFLNTMSFLEGRHVVTASLVNKAWLSVSRRPSLWKKLDESSGLTNSSKKLNMTSFLKLLSRPQFANLKALTMPYKLTVGKSGIQKIAKACPHLEMWDYGYSRSTCGGNDVDLLEAAERFTNLTSIRTDMWKVTTVGIKSLVKAMGGQLLDLRIKGDCITKNFLSDAALGVIATNCPNLKHFGYTMAYVCYYDAEQDPLSGAGVIALVKGCRRLEVLEIEHSKQVRKEDFLTIMNMVAQDDAASDNAGSDGKKFALRKIIVVGYPFVITGNPFSIEDVPIPRSNAEIALERLVQKQRAIRSMAGGYEEG
ncbi:hypothetical protein ACHAXR_002983 [Thalassiosira sp. AJA248-18]